MCHLDEPGELSVAVRRLVADYVTKAGRTLVLAGDQAPLRATADRSGGRLLAATRRSRVTIASMDLLIATAALLEDAAVVTRNVKDFSRPF